VASSEAATADLAAYKDRRQFLELRVSSSAGNGHRGKKKQEGKIKTSEVGYESASIKKTSLSSARPHI
jgi:hypothetical protein